MLPCMATIVINLFTYQRAGTAMQASETSPHVSAQSVSEAEQPCGVTVTGQGSTCCRSRPVEMQGAVCRPL